MLDPSIYPSFWGPSKSIENRELVNQLAWGSM